MQPSETEDAFAPSGHNPSPKTQSHTGGHHHAPRMAVLSLLGIVIGIIGGLVAEGLLRTINAQQGVDEVSAQLFELLDSIPAAARLRSAHRKG